MGLFHYLWSRTAASNATADANINWAEGQSPSSVNDSARAMMASAAAFRDDIAGAIATGGTSGAYTVTSYQIFDTLAHMSGQMIAFSPHTTNTANCTLNVDGLGAKSIRATPGEVIPAGVLIQGTPYTALYNNSDAVWYLQNFYGQPFTVPVGGVIDYFGGSAPSSNFVFPFGQAVSRTTYATLFTVFGTTYGVGDGSTTFNIPDLRGRVLAGADNMGGSAAGRLTTATMNAGTLSGVGGAETHALAASQIPTITTAGSASVSGTTSTPIPIRNLGGGVATLTDFSSGGSAATSAGSLSTPGTFSGSGSTSATSNNTGGGAHNNVQPTIVSNKLLRII